MERMNWLVIIHMMSEEGTCILMSGVGWGGGGEGVGREVEEMRWAGGELPGINT